MKNIKLTDAQTELIKTHLPHRADQIESNRITLDNLQAFTLEIEELTVRLDAEPYTQDTARHKFAAKYLYRKLTNDDQPTTPARAAAKTKDTPLTDDQLTGEMVVRLIGDPEKQTFKVKYHNSDGSWCVYGGTVNHQSYRNFYASNLTTD